MGIGCLVYNTFHVGYVFGACLEVVICMGSLRVKLILTFQRVFGRTEVGYVAICADSNTTSELASRVEERNC